MLSAPPPLLVFALMLGVALAMAARQALVLRRRRARQRAMEERMDVLLQRLGARAKPPTPGDVLAEWRHLRERDDPPRRS